MPAVRDAAFDLFRRRGMTTMFGNPGSTELPMLADFPDDFTYVLGLQEAVAVGMADGYAQALGRPTHVNLHTAPGVGNHARAGSNHLRGKRRNQRRTEEVPSVCLHNSEDPPGGPAGVIWKSQQNLTEI